MSRTILLVDDNDDFRESAVWLLEALGYAVRAFGSPAHFLADPALPPTDASDVCLLLDVRMPGLSGLQVHDALLARGIGWPVVYMTGHGDVPLAVEAMQKGACSFLEKPFQDAVLERTLDMAFERAARERSARDNRVATSPPTQPAAATGSNALATTPAEAADAGIDPEFARMLDSLTPRERQVLDLVVAGLLNKTIADRLGISIKTVELHRSRVMQKMGARSFADLMRRVLTRGGVPA
jgi:two-component system response regulator FixJ